MADINVKNQSSNQRSKAQNQSNSQEVQHQGGGSGLTRGRGYDPFGSWVGPEDFFRSNPFTLMRRMSEEMDRTFGQFFGPTSAGTSRGWHPEIELNERDGQLHVHADLPGLKPDDVKVEINNDSLIISGERKLEHEHHIGGAYRSERRYGQFYREIPLPEGTNAEQAKAHFRDGVLEITVPVSQQVSSRRQIPVQTSEATGAPSKGPVSEESTRQQQTAAKAAS